MAKERKASVIYEGNASQLVYAFPFDYLRKKFVKVEDIYTNITELTIGVDYTVEDKQVRLVKGIPLGHFVKIYRETTTAPMVEWQDASVLRSADMTLQELQLLHIQEEYNDHLNEELGVGKSFAEQAKDAAEEAKNYKDIAIAGQVQADWDEDNSEEKSFVKNKPNLNVFTKTYASVADMKCDRLIHTGMYVATQGYYTPYDGGQATYKISDTKGTEDAGSCHMLANGLYAYLVVNDDIINVKTFGAKGDGVHDDADAINKLYRFANTHHYREWFPTGTYSTSITVNVTEDVGMAKGAIIKATAKREICVQIQPDSVAHPVRLNTTSSNVNVDANKLCEIGIQSGAEAHTHFLLFAQNATKIGIRNSNGKYNQENTYDIWCANSEIGVETATDNTYGIIITMSCKYGVYVTTADFYCNTLHSWGPPEEFDDTAVLLMKNDVVATIGVCYQDTTNYLVYTNTNRGFVVNIDTLVVNYTKGLTGKSKWIKEELPTTSAYHSTIQIGTFIDFYTNSLYPWYTPLPMYELKLKTIKRTTTGTLQFSDCNNLPSEGTFAVAWDAANMPTKTGDYSITCISDGRHVMQIAHQLFTTTPSVYYRWRALVDETWHNWSSLLQ